MIDRTTTCPPLDDPRAALLREWLQCLPAELALEPASLRAASNDASFRRYFRITPEAPWQGRRCGLAPGGHGYARLRVV